ncbi:MAG: TlpA family protein disulfide reductase [Eubacterium sp.]|nr:TlpA family protein disulfide reductase [Eubacterium sp.]
MKKKSSLIIIIIVLIAVIAGASFAYNHLAQKGSTQNLASNGESVENDAMDDTATENDAAASETPDFTVIDKDGNTVRLSDFQGKPVILNFWASWCGPCRAEMPDFDEMYAQYGDEIHFVMVNATDGSRETVDSAQAFIEDAGYSFPVYFDTTQEASMTFGAYSLPTTYFIDAAGQPIAYATGTISKDIMLQGIDMIYSE